MDAEGLLELKDQLTEAQQNAIKKLLTRDQLTILERTAKKFNEKKGGQFLTDAQIETLRQQANLNADKVAFLKKVDGFGLLELREELPQNEIDMIIAVLTQGQKEKLARMDKALQEQGGGQFLTDAQIESLRSSENLTADQVAALKKMNVYAIIELRKELTEAQQDKIKALLTEEQTVRLVRVFEQNKRGGKFLTDEQVAKLKEMANLNDQQVTYLKKLDAFGLLDLRDEIPEENVKQVISVLTRDQLAIL